MSYPGLHSPFCTCLPSLTTGPFYVTLVDLMGWTLRHHLQSVLYVTVTHFNKIRSTALLQSLETFKIPQSLRIAAWRRLGWQKSHPLPSFWNELPVTIGEYFPLERNVKHCRKKIFPECKLSCLLKRQCAEHSLGECFGIFMIILAFL